MDQAIDQGDDAGGVWKDLAPFDEGPVCGDDRAVVLVTAADSRSRKFSAVDRPSCCAPTSVMATPC